MPEPTSVSDTLYHSLVDQLPSSLSTALMRCKRLPTLPLVALNVLDLSRSAEATLGDYANAIEHDPALTAKVMSVANSVHYLRVASPAHRCFDATQRIGLDATLATVLSYCLFESDHVAQSRLQFWQRAITAAAVAGYLAKQLCPEQAGCVFTTALLQDIGMLALHTAYPADADSLYGHEYTAHSHIRQLEERHFGCDHALVGAWLLARWGVHDDLIRAIQGSHQAPDPQDSAAFCLSVSGAIADAWLSADPAQALAGVIRQLNALAPDSEAAMPGLLAHLEQTLPALMETLGLSKPATIESVTLLHEAQELLFDHTLTLSTRLNALQKAQDTLFNDYALLKQRSRIDPLTQLANRAWLEEQLRERFHLCQSANRTMSVVFIDLDHFKALNDRFGHQVGDDVLTRFGKVLASLIRSGDLAGRYGGEEFLVILPDEGAEGAKCFAQRIHHCLQERPMAHIAQEAIYVSVSMGVACLTDGDFASERELIDAADQSMYATKRSGRGGVTIYGQ